MRTMRNEDCVRVSVSVSMVRHMEYNIADSRVHELLVQQFSFRDENWKETERRRRSGSRPPSSVEVEWVTVGRRIVEEGGAGRVVVDASLFGSVIGDCQMRLVLEIKPRRNPTRVRSHPRSGAQRKTLS